MLLFLSELKNWSELTTILSEKEEWVSVLMIWMLHNTEMQ